jgi:hypothetical protein
MSFSSHWSINDIVFVAEMSFLLREMFFPSRQVGLALEHQLGKAIHHSEK